MRVTSLIVGAWVAVAASAQAGPAEEVSAAVQALQDAINKGDADAVKALLADDHVSITTYARLTGAEALVKALPDFKFTENRLSKVKVQPVTDDVALALYRGVVKGTYKGVDVPGRVHVVAVWAKKDGKWREVSYQETPAPVPEKK